MAFAFVFALSLWLGAAALALVATIDLWARSDGSIELHVSLSSNPDDPDGKDVPPPRPRRGGGRRGPPPEPVSLEEAKRRLFRAETGALIRKWLYGLTVDYQDRSDVKQDIMERAFRSFPTYDPKKSRPERWLNSITVHTASHHHDRAYRRREELTDELPEYQDDDADPETLLLTAEQQETATTSLQEMIAALPYYLRPVLSGLRDGLSMKDIATMLGIPLSTAYKWRARAFAMVAQNAEVWRAR